MSHALTKITLLRTGTPRFFCAAEGTAWPLITPTRLLFFAPVLRIFSFSRPQGYEAFTLQGAGSRRSFSRCGACALRPRAAGGWR